MPEDVVRRDVVSCSTVSTIRPWYMTLIRSDRSKTSWMSWLIRKMPMPSSLSWRTRLRTCAVSAGPSAAVGSSMIRIRALKWTARAMATAWRWPPDSDLTGCAKFVKFGFSRPMTLRVSASMLESSSEPEARRQLAAEEQVARRVDVVGQGERLVDRLDVVAPWRRAGCGSRPACRRSGSRRVSAGWAPDSTRISVDLPAPLPPTRPMTSPGVQVDASRRARRGRRRRRR